VTDPPQGRDGSPSAAALAVHVNELRRRIESVASWVDSLATAQREHAAVLDGITELRDQVEQILATLTGEDEALPAEWFWLRMNEQVREEKLAELFDWVQTLLRTQYPGLPRGPDQALLAKPSRGQMGTVLALPAVVPHLPSQTISPERRGGVARPLVPRRDPPSERRHELVRGNLPAPARPQAGWRFAKSSTAMILQLSAHFICARERNQP